MQTANTFTRKPTGELVVSVVLGTDTELLTMTPRQLASHLTSKFVKAEEITANYLDGERQRHHNRASSTSATSRPDSTLPALTTDPTCKGCGTSVERAGQLCANCEHKTQLQAPEATIALKHQGEPLYKREGNFRDLREETQGDGDIQRVSES